MPLPSNFRLPTGRALLIVAAFAFVFMAGWFPVIGWTGFALCIAAFFALFITDRAGANKRWLNRAADPIILAPPFEDAWRVVSGGPDPKHNHHVSDSDQYFAYDFARVDGDSWDQPILAPCDGMIVHVEDRQDDAPPGERHHDSQHPFGNYVSIQTPRGYVILAHLKRGSVAVRVGDGVRAGTPIARCGNSGSSGAAHLHVHAQDQPSQSIDTARGIPVAFTDRLRSEPLLLEFGDRLG